MPESWLASDRFSIRWSASERGSQSQWRNRTPREIVGKPSQEQGSDSISSVETCPSVGWSLGMILKVRPRRNSDQNRESWPGRFQTSESRALECIATCLFSITYVFLYR